MLQTIEINPSVSPGATVIWMHGLGASGDDFVDIIPLLGLPPESNVRFVFPHAPLRIVKYVGNAKIRAWFDVADIGPNVAEDEIGLRESEKLIDQLIERELAQGIPSQKIVLVGFSQGGAMALQCGLRYPEKLAGILVLSAWVPLIKTVALERNTANQQTPILMLHGSNDDLIQLDWAKEGCDSLQEIGYNATLAAYKMQHTVCAEEIETIGAWLRNLLCD